MVCDTWESPVRQERLGFSSPQTPLPRLKIVYDTSEAPAHQERLVSEAPEPRIGWNENAARAREAGCQEYGIRDDLPQAEGRQTRKRRLASEAASW